MATTGYSGTPLLKKLGLRPEHRIWLINPPADYAELIQSDISNQVCIHSQPTELLKPYIQNWPYDDLLRNVSGLTVGMILWLSNFIYGGLHAAA